MNTEKERPETLVFAQSVLTIGQKNRLSFSYWCINWLYERVLQALQPYKCLVFNVDQADTKQQHSAHFWVEVKEEDHQS